MLSDGILNSGGSPIHPNHGTPIFSLGLGDPKSVPDVNVVNVLANRSVFKGNETLLETNIRMKKCLGSNVLVQLFDGDKLITQKNVLPNEENQIERFEFPIKPLSTGKHIYSVRVTVQKEERNKANNSKAVIIDVEENEKKIHIVAHGPHPDIGALKAALKPEKTFSVYLAQLNEPIRSSDIYIVHGIPEARQESAFLNRLVDSKAPFWCITTARSRPSLWSSFSEGFEIRQRGGMMNQAAAVANKEFSQFFLTPEVLSSVERFPPLQSPFLNINGGVKLKPLFTQKIGNVSSDIPLWAFLEKDNQRTAWLFGEGIWRWRMADFKKNKSWNNVDELIVKTIQYLSSSTIKNGFTTYPSSAFLPQGQAVVLTAEYTDETGRRVNEYPASATIRGENGFKKAVQFAPFQDVYRANIGSLPPGKYEYVAQLQGARSPKDQSFFVVQKSNPEAEQMEANHSLLKKWSSNSKGKFTTDLDSLVQIIKTSVSANSVLSESRKSKSVLEFWPYLLFVVFCFSAEWFLRKYLGKY